MSLQLEDGKGTGRLAKVSTEHRLLTRSVSEGPLEDASERGDAAYFHTTYAASTGEEIISIKNGESEKVLHISRVLWSTTVNSRFTLFEVTSGTAAGTTLTYQNPNLDSGIDNSGTFFGNASVTGSLAGNNLLQVSVLANTQHETFLEGSLQLSNGDEIAITVTGTSPTVYVTVIGFWHSET